MLASTISIVPETTTIEILTKLFEKIHAPPHGTPSYGQLQAVRAIAMPLAKSLDLKDQVAILHVWLCNEFGNHRDRGYNGSHPYSNKVDGATNPIPDNSI